MIYVRSDARHLFAAEKSVADFLRIPCNVVRTFKNRSTGRFIREGRAYYIKVHHPGGWWPLADELLHLRWPQVGARSEWRALEKVREHGILVPQVVAYGEEGQTPANQRSFLITEEIAPAISLKMLAEKTMENSQGPSSLEHPRSVDAQHTVSHSPQTDCSWQNGQGGFRRRLIRKLARTARTLHSNGINHRDFYLCHFLLCPSIVSASAAAASTTAASVGGESPRLYLMDLHRAQMRRRTPRRWIVKDLAALLFSAMDVDLSARDFALFVHCYSGRSVRAELSARQSLWRAVRRRAKGLYEKIHQRPPQLDLSGVFE